MSTVMGPTLDATQFSSVPHAGTLADPWPGNAIQQALLALPSTGGTKNLGHRFIGKNVDALVSEFGQPQNIFRSGETAYVWQLSAVNHNHRYAGGSVKTN